MAVVQSIQKLPSATLIHPLDDFYARAEVPLPPVSEVDAMEMPEPYRSLLVHPNDMTSTLEKFHGDRIHLRLHGKRQIENDYFREVVLQLDASRKPVEFGAIHIHLDLFPAEARHWILQEYLPLGRILNENAIQYTSSPVAFLRFASDKLINELLGLTGVQFLYGRRNRLLDAKKRPLAEIIEILPPAEAKKTES
jgi:chorismate-pyruvate lyase